MALMWLVAGLVSGVATVGLFITPARSEPVPADAVVVLAGGSGERIERGLDLIRRGYAGVLVVSTGTGGAADAVDCDTSPAEGQPTVICVAPPSDNTRGEAQMVADLAAEHGWSRVLVVTSTYHVTRSRWIFERCVDAEVVAIAATPDIPLHTQFNAVFHELAGALIAQTVQRGC